ncbi:MAG: Glycosyltransferase [uncultured Quadrisphaera sp.]|uniref:Glycosyltransferase n=1 Tax=uncultured Quadrisphaera sp. TaxID=904978 RepID=A0A6J4Q6G7_9ACTN|nr:MAG: Glycosyltransferase [uncultured Quadrisphaera sp.]
MRVLIGSDTYYPDVNGASYFTQRLVAGLQQRGHEVQVVAAARTARSEVVVRGGTTEHRVRSLPVPGHPGFRATPPGVRRRVRAAVLAARPDVVHAQGHFAIGRALIRAARELGIPVVATNHFMPDNLVYYLGLPTPLERAVEAWAWKDFARVFNGADVVTAPTPFAAALAEAEGVRGPVTAVSCGMDLSRFSPDVDPAPFRARHHLDARPTITYVGRLDAEKHVDELIRALPLVRATVDAQLVVVGTGHEHEALVALAAAQGVAEHVRFTGFVADADLPGAYAAASVAVNPGTAELQSIVTLEAMASGRPVVGADARALPLLVHEGSNGHLFTPGDVVGLAAALTHVLTDDDARASMGRQSLRLVAAHDVAATLDTFEGLYAALLPTAPVRPPALLAGAR